MPGGITFDQLKPNQILNYGTLQCHEGKTQNDQSKSIIGVFENFEI